MHVLTAENLEQVAAACIAEQGETEVAVGDTSAGGAEAPSEISEVPLAASNRNEPTPLGPPIDSYCKPYLTGTACATGIANMPPAIKPKISFLILILTMAALNNAG